MFVILNGPLLATDAAMAILDESAEAERVRMQRILDWFLESLSANE